MATKWTKDLITSTLQTRHAQGLPLNRTSMVKEGLSGLCLACDRLYGSYAQGVEEAGISYKSVTQRYRWTNKEIVEGIQALVQQGINPNAQEARHHNPALFAAGYVRYGSWCAALEATGLVPDEIHLKPLDVSYKGNAFENIAYQIFDILRPDWKKKRPFHRDGVNYRPDLYDPSTENWIDLKWSAHGRSADKSIRHYSPHCNELVIIHVLGDREAKGNVKFVSIYDYYPGPGNSELDLLFNLVTQILAPGSEEIVLNLSRKWTRETILEQILELPEEDLNPYSMEQRHNALYKAARKQFESWSNALREAGLDPALHRKRREYVRSKLRYTKDYITDWLKQQHSQGLPFDSKYMVDNHVSMLGAAKRLFGSWKAALESANIDPSSALLIAERKYVTKEELDQFIQDRRNRQETLSSTWVRANCGWMDKAAAKHYGGWTAALQANGVEDPKFMTLEQVDAWLQDRIANSLSLNGGWLKGKEGGCSNQHTWAVRYYGSWKAAVEHNQSTISQLSE